MRQQLTAKQANFVKQLYREKVSPALTNLMINQTKNFPYLRDKSIYLAVKLTKKDERNSFLSLRFPILFQGVLFSYPNTVNNMSCIWMMY